MVELKKKLNIKSNNYLYVLEIINSKNHKARLVGGVVRDAILGIESEDIDIITTMLPEELIKVFRALGHKVLPTGIRFGTVSILYNGELFEVTTLRKDISSDGRHAKIEYTKDFYIDALRRDFTINALSYCPFAEKIFDYFHGIEHLTLGYVKFIGDPELRIQEDYLRILRFFRFFGKFGRKIDQNSFQACIKYKSFIKKLSRERIKSELNLILRLPNYCDIIRLMNDCSVLQEVLPLSHNLGLEKFVSAKKIAEKFGILLSTETKYALLFALSSNNISYTHLINLRFSRIEARHIDKLLAIKKENIDEDFLKKIWFENDDFEQFFVFLAALSEEKEKIENIFLQLQHKQKKIFPITGKEIADLGISITEIKRELRYLQEKWIKSDFELTKQNLIKMLKQENDK
jgi:poly(A) polymerase